MFVIYQKIPIWGQMGNLVPFQAKITQYESQDPPEGLFLNFAA